MKKLLIGTSLIFSVLFSFSFSKSNQYWNWHIRSHKAVNTYRLFLENSGANAIGPNWKLAIEEAVKRYNAVPYTCIHLAITPQRTFTYDILINVKTFPTPDPITALGRANIESRVIELIAIMESEGGFYGNFEARTMVAMHEIGHILCIAHSNENLGAYNLIEGTPDVYNIGSTASSIFSYGVAESKDFTQTDINALQILYPGEAVNFIASGSRYWMSTRQQDGFGEDRYWGSARSFMKDKISGAIQNLNYTFCVGKNNNYFNVPLCQYVEYYWVNENKAIVKEYSTGVVWATDDCAVNTKWNKIFTANGKRVQVEGNRFAVLMTNGDLKVNEGSSTSPFSTVMTGIIRFKMAGNRIYALKPNGALYMNEGPISSPFTLIAGGITQFDVCGDRIVVIFNNGAMGKQGSAPWVGLSGRYFYKVNNVQVTNELVGFSGFPNSSQTTQEFWAAKGPIGTPPLYISKGNTVKFDLKANYALVAQKGIGTYTFYFNHNSEYPIQTEGVLPEAEKFRQRMP